MDDRNKGKGPPPALLPDHPLFGLGYAEPVQTRPLLKLQDDASRPGEAAVAEEVPIALVYNGRPHLVMMGTPADLEDFAVGFTLTEEIVGEPSQITRLEVVRHARGIELLLDIPAEAGERVANRGRRLAGRTGCGLCGVETIDEAIRESRRVAPLTPIPVEALWRAEAALPGLQRWNNETGSLHAAAWATLEGQLEIVREDVGRHNALDKVIGALARSGRTTDAGFLVVTSRASYEMVQKATVAGVRLLAAVSRPTGLAIRLAQASGLTLVALLRGRTANVYAPTIINQEVTEGNRK